MLDDDVTMVNLNIKGNADLLNQMFADKNFPALEMTSKPTAPPPGTVDNTSDSDSTEEWKKKRSKQSQMDKKGWSDANRASKEATTSSTRSYSSVVSRTGGASNRESRLVIEEYGPKIVYLPGKHNIIADALSRVPKFEPHDE
jgi:hypothetical protein